MKDLTLKAQDLFVGAYVFDPIQNCRVQVKIKQGDLINVENSFRYRKVSTFTAIPLRIVDLVTECGFDLLSTQSGDCQSFYNKKLNSVVLFKENNFFIKGLKSYISINSLHELQLNILKVSKEPLKLKKLSDIEDLILRNKYLVQHLVYSKNYILQLESNNMDLIQILNSKNSKQTKIYENTTKRKSNTKKSSKRKQNSSRNSL